MESWPADGLLCKGEPELAGLQCNAFVRVLHKLFSLLSPIKSSIDPCLLGWMKNKPLKWFRRTSEEQKLLGLKSVGTPVKLETSSLKDRPGFSAACSQWLGSSGEPVGPSEPGKKF